MWLKSQRSNRPAVRIRPRHAHLLVTHRFPVSEKIIVVGRQEVSAFADRVKKAAVVGWREIDDLSVSRD
jgi:hypothetical protein